MKTRIILFLIFSVLVSCNGWADNKKRKFKNDFLFGVGTSAYQVEGAWNEDGKSESIWDRFVHEKPERVFGSDSGDVACDSYHQVKRDVEMLREIGAQFYRFSISWSRFMQTDDPLKLNDEAFTYYDKLIDELKKFNIEPMVTLYHWDLPQKIEDLGGWLNPKITEWFPEFSRFIFKRYASKVKYWITVNQPNTVCLDGYGTGMGAPGILGDGEKEYLCMKHILIAHAHAYHVYKKEFKQKHKGQVGIALSINWFDPLTNSTEHKEKAEETRQFAIGLFANPIFSKEGDFPEVVKRIVAKKSTEEGLPQSRLPTFCPNEIKLLKGSADFLGMNHYTTFLVEEGQGKDPGSSVRNDMNMFLTQSPQWVQSKAVWMKSAPYGLYKASLWINKMYDYPQIFITENGWATDTGFNDTNRVEYIRNYLDALLLAIEDGTQVKGYTYWSLMDNFEWIFGYGDRFGLYEVDFTSEKKTRTSRYSALIYKKIIETRQVDHEYNPKYKKLAIAKKSKREEL